MFRKYAPWSLLVLGLLVMLGAFLCGAGNALPYQDPTAELLAYQAAKAAKINAVFILGFLVAVASGVWLWKRLRSKKRVLIRNPALVAAAVLSVDKAQPQTAICADRASRWAGMGTGPADLSTNPEHMAGFGQQKPI